MIRLEPNKSLKVVLSGAVTTNQLPVSVDYVHVTATGATPKEADAATNGTTAVTVLAAPSASEYYLIDGVTVPNEDTAAATVRVVYDNNGTQRTRVKVTLQVGDALIYDDKGGWYVLTAAGLIKTSTSAGGTVSSVDVSGGSTGLTASGGPVTGSGTITLGGTLASGSGGTGVDNGGRTLTVAANSGAVSFSSAALTLTVAGAASVSGTNTGDQSAVTGNAGTATALQTARTINGVAFDGTAGITVPAAAGTLTGATLAAGVTASSLTSVGTLTAGTWSATTIAVDKGGTGATSATAYAVLCGGTTATGAFQSVSGLGSAGEVLTSNGAGALPTWQAAGGGGSGSPGGSDTHVQFNSAGTFGGSANFTWADSSRVMTVSGDAAGSAYAVQVTSGASIKAYLGGGSTTATAGHFEDGSRTVDVAAGAGAVVATDGGRTARLADGTQAGRFTDGSNTVNLCDGTNHVSYAAANSGNWAGGSAPTDVWVALDRVAAALTTLGQSP